jgi:hypothetical protein
MAGKGGARPGAGRKPGVPTKATVEREILAQRILAEQAGRRPDKKLGKEVLDDFMHLFAGLAAYHQPVPKNMTAPADREPDEGKFKEYAGFAIKCASELANYQSPKFKAVAISIEAGPGAIAPSNGEAPGMRVISAQESYKMLRDGDLIDMKVNKPAAAAPAAVKKRGAA